MTYYMTDEELQARIDECIENGWDIIDSIGLPPVEHKGPDYNIRAVVEYCKKRGIEANELTDEELKQFEV